MASIVCLLIQLYMLVIFARIIMSWFPPTPGTTYAQIFEGFDKATEPVLAPIRAMLPPVRMGGMGLDLSPIVVFVIGTLLLRVIC
jgi:YggT family protein